ncbi:MAG: hypothetical protein ACM32I_10945 [Nitrospirota bacterium]
MKKAFVAALMIVLTAAPSTAKTTIDIPGGYSQSEFRDLSTELGLAVSYVPLAPAEPLGGLLPGLDAGIELTTAKISKDAKFWSDVVQGSLPAYLPFYKVHIQAGFPGVPLDLGFVYSQVPNTDIKLLGGEIKYAILKGGVFRPAVSVRGAYTRLSGVDVIDISTRSLDLSISKRILMVTPYAGVGLIWISSTPEPAVAGLTLSKENITETKSFIGFKFSFLPVLNMTAEADFAKVKAYSVRLNLHF